MSIANIGSNLFDTTFGAAVSALGNGLTLMVTEDISGQSAVGTINGVSNVKVLGQRKADGKLRKMTVDQSVRPAWQKAVINVEDVNGAEIGHFDISGAYWSDSTAAAIRINPGAKGDIVLHHMRLHDNQNGILTSDPNANLYMFNMEVTKNGTYVGADMNGKTHDIYIGAMSRVEAYRSSFVGSPYGHEFKSRALVTVLKRCLCADSANGRALDIPNGGTLYAEDTIFRTLASAGQSNLADVGAEGVPDGRKQFYLLWNCRFHSDVPIGRDAQFFRNRTDVEVFLVNPQFTGAATAKDFSQTVVGKVTIIKTGDVLGPRFPDTEIGGNPDKVLDLPAFAPTTIPAVPKDISEATPVATVPGNAGTTPAASGAMTISLTPELMALASKLAAPPTAATPSPVDSLGAEFANMVGDALSDRTRKSTITVTITPDGIATKVTHPK